ncbi:MAG: TolC family protein [Gammaproteobacteria bacterium]|nr:TolC family protein [Gammaproteobacteria bacterium]
MNTQLADEIIITNEVLNPDLQDVTSKNYRFKLFNLPTSLPKNPVLLFDDTTFRPVVPKISHWPISWSGLMMNTFIALVAISTLSLSIGHASSTHSTSESIIEAFSASGTPVKEPAIFDFYSSLFKHAYSTAPEIIIARNTLEQKAHETYTATAKRYLPAVDAQLSQVHELNYSDTDATTEFDTSYKDDRDYTDWSLDLNLPLFDRSLSVGLQIAKAEKKLARNALDIATHELNLKLKELLGNYLESTYRLFNIRNSVKLSGEHVAKINKGYELRDQTKLQLLRAQANLKGLEARLDFDEQAQEVAFRALLDFTGLETSDPLFSELESLLQDEMKTASCINSLAAIDENYIRIQNLIESTNSQELFIHFQQHSYLYHNIVLERIVSKNKAHSFTQNEWFDISIQGKYDRRDDTKFNDYDGEGTLSLVLSVPIFSGGTLYSSNKSKASALKIAETKETADIRAQYHALENTRKLITSLQNVYQKQQINLQQQQEIVILSLKSYQIKQTSMQDLLTSQNTLIDVKNNLIQTTNRLGTLFRQFAWQMGTPYPAPDITSQ